MRCEMANSRCNKDQVLLLLYKESSGKCVAGVMAELCDFPWVKLYRGLIKLIAAFHQPANSPRTGHAS